MKNKFHQYYRPTSEEFEVIWEDALVVTDANILLNLYTYSQETWQEFLNVLKEMENQLWLPFQAAEEFHRNRCGIILKEARRYGTIKKEIQGISDALGARKQHPFVAPDVLSRFSDSKVEIEAALKEGEETHFRLIRDDPIRDQLTKLFNGRVGDHFDDQRLEEIFAEGANRYDKKVPPGYQDHKKPAPERYGDLILWKEILQEASEKSKNIIFVTDDVKDDWWLHLEKEKLGPRPELLDEFRTETGKQLYIYTSETFLEAMEKRGKKISAHALAEIEASGHTRINIVDDLEQIRKNTLDPLAALTSSPLTTHLDVYKEQQRKIQEILEPLSALTSNSLTSHLDSYKEQQRKIQEALTPLSTLANAPIRTNLDVYTEQQRKIQETLDPLSALKNLSGKDNNDS